MIAVIVLKDIQFHGLATCQDGPKALGKVLLGYVYTCFEIYVYMHIHGYRFAVAMVLGAVFAWFVPEVQDRRTRRNISLERLALGRQPPESEGTELGTMASRTGQCMGHHPRLQT